MSLNPASVRMYQTVKPVQAIYYTTDGSEPTERSLLYPGSPINIDDGRSAVTIKAFAVFEDGTRGSITEANYTFTERMPSVKFLPHTGANTPLLVELSVPGYEGDPEVLIYYNILNDIGNVDDPDESSTIYSGLISVDIKATIKAFAIKPGMRASLITMAQYARASDYGNVQLPQVVFSPSSGSSSAFPVSVTMSVPNHPTGATIIYTLNGDDPDLYTGTIYTGPIPLGNPADTTFTLKAFATKLYYIPSAVSTKVYTKATAPVPTFFPDGTNPVPLNQSVALSSSLQNSTIYYTTDGDDPVVP